jgi:hypothetical protein
LPATPADLGHTLTCVVSAINCHGVGLAPSSNAIAITAA